MRWTLVSIVALLVVGFIGWGVFEHLKEIRKVRGRYIAGTVGSGYVMEDGIKSSCNVNGDFPCELTTIPTNLPAAVMFAGLMSVRPASYMLYDGGEEVAKRKRTFLDTWGNEFHFRIEKSQRKSESLTRPLVLKIFIWSNGSNQKDQSGKGDDISRTFEVEVPENAVRAPDEFPRLK